ncbi:carboxylesterase/lipase family protein [Sphingomonas sp. BAUL-RG-20F-R05-02]|uniref:carboxylesterase/lipase family protein n=1 Tax=Sphingomonas sp. BAUL-RG-20F-R05-02 TaxID=2914830 RepID=UPI001F562051|nr:carboxylesterase family protein [Sphingomonas sp. BAUL-RG-20F-R05-02]
MSAPAPTRRTVVGAAVALIGATPLRALAADPVVTCHAGPYSGMRMAGVTAFRGIRYGRADRFKAPTAISAQRDVLRAVTPAPACPQRGKRHPQSENCLALNVWTPSVHDAAMLPVLVYVHGGGYAYGSANDEITDGQALAARGIVVVTVNHRLNALGYLHLAPFDARFADSGNAGQSDLVLALQWVRANIAAFGGDPGCVTLAGQSGGGAKIATLLAMPVARGLFHRALTMSGQQITVSEPDHAAARTRVYLAGLDVAGRDVAELADLPVERLIEALETPDPIERSQLYFGPVRDGRWLTRHPFSPDAHPAGRDVPLMLGGTRDETRDFFDPGSVEMRRLTWETLPERVAAELPFPAPPSAVIRAYREHTPNASPPDVFYAATTDGRSWRPQLIEAEERTRAGRTAYVYQVDFTSRTDPARGAFHGIDIALLFGTLGASDAGTGTAADARALSERLQDHVIAFAQTGRPDRPGLPQWPPYDLDRRATMIFDTKSRVENDPRQWQRNMFAPYTYNQPGT